MQAAHISSEKLIKKLFKQKISGKAPDSSSSTAGRLRWTMSRDFLKFFSRKDLTLAPNEQEKKRFQELFHVREDILSQSLNTFLRYVRKFS